MHYDYIICGHGIAGAVLAQTLKKGGYSVIVFDGHLPHSASSAAAGLWNPISFKNLKLSWMANEFIETATSFYQSIELESKRSFFHQKEMSRLFHSTADINEWDTRSTSESLRGHIETDTTNKLSASIVQPYGYGVVKQSGWLNTPEFLLASKELLSNHFQEETMNYSNLQITEDSIYYKDIQASGIIFCEGYRIVSNPWFGYLPVEPNKGQVQTLKGDLDTADRIFHFGKFLLPTEPGIFRFGATYEFNDPNPEPTQITSQLMQEELKSVCTSTFEILEEKTGYRPTLPDRKPLLGFHPTHKNLWVFNGMGSRGVIMAPYCGVHFMEYLKGVNTLDPTMNITRYRRFFNEN
jgi:glycine oxidase